MDPVLISVLSAAGTVAAILFGWSAWKDRNHDDDAESGRNMGTLVSDVGYIKSSIDDMKKGQEKMEERYIEIVSRLTSVEASSKQAHKRLDDMTKENKAV